MKIFFNFLVKISFDLRSNVFSEYFPVFSPFFFFLQAGKLLTSWFGYGLNYLRYKLSMDNSLSGSKSNIEAHYDLSNELFKLFLDKNYMLYSCGVFEADIGRLSFCFASLYLFVVRVVDYDHG